MSINMLHLVYLVSYNSLSLLHKLFFSFFFMELVIHADGQNYSGHIRVFSASNEPLDSCSSKEGYILSIILISFAFVT